MGRPVLSRRRSLGRVTAAAALALGAALMGAGQAAAATWQSDFFQPNGLLSEPSTRASTVQQLEHLGVNAVRVMLSWDQVAPKAGSPNKPRFNATNPANYNWGTYASTIEEAKRLHWSVLLTVASPVPKWATAAHRDFLTRPNARDFAEFMTAVGREFRSEVSVWAIWNEPNQLGWLQPQFNSNGTPASPGIYRNLFVAGYAGLRQAGISHPKVLMGETAPFGYSYIPDPAREGLNHNLSPLAFLRSALCLSSDYQKAKGCGELPAYGYAHHAYTNSQGPSYVPPGPDEVSIGTLGRLVRALNLAAGAHAIRANMPIYLTEFGINTRPNSLGVPPARQAEQDAIAEHIAWENPRVAAFSQYALRDDPIPRHHPPGWIGFQTGLETASGAPKPLFYAWPLPLVVRREAHGYYLWGLVRPARGVTRVQVLVYPGHNRPWRTIANVQTGPRRYWVLRSSVTGVCWRVRWVGPNHTVYEGPPIGAS